jgi:hypothetical protein
LETASRPWIWATWLIHKKSFLFDEGFSDERGGITANLLLFSYKGKTGRT